MDEGGFDKDEGNQQFQTTPKKGNKSGVQSIYPVTVHQILEATQDPNESFLIANNEVHLITFVGSVLNGSENTTSTNYSVEDGTGQIDVRIWIDQSTEESKSKKS